MEVVTLSAQGTEYRIHNPGEGRVAQWLNKGAPYEHKLLRFVAELPVRGALFDVGAHIGNHSLYWAAAGFRVYAWEPYPDSLRQLRDNLALNDFDIEVYAWAAGASDTVGRFTKGMWLEFDPNREGDKLQLERGDVPVHRIDDMIDVPDLSVVKVDVEGMEHHVLAGLVRHLERSHPHVFCEAHTPRARKMVGQVLGPLGYEYRQTIQMGSPMDYWR